MNKLFSFLSLCSLAVAPVVGQQAAQTQKQSNPCDCLDRGLELPLDTKCFSPAYLAPANVKLNDCWDVDVTASFIYWHVSQENMNVAYHEPAVSSSVNHYNMSYPEFSYKPGFKLGFGFNTNYDDWTGFFEYTWLHQNTSHTSTAGSSTEIKAVNVLSDTLVGYTSVNSHWKMNMDKLDFGMSRPFYFSKRITMLPVGGLRALWIRQNFNNTYETSTQELLVKSKSHSWAFGPMFGTATRWFFGEGFRFEGKGNGALLYTRYTKVSSKQVAGTTTDVAHQHDYNCLRPMMDLGIGFGWGTYIGCQDYYIDLSASYDFNLFWDQNVMLNNIQSFNQDQPVAGTNGNLYMHGLTLNARFDF